MRSCPGDRILLSRSGSAFAADDGVVVVLDCFPTVGDQGTFFFLTLVLFRTGLDKVTLAVLLLREEVDGCSCIPSASVPLVASIEVVSWLRLGTATASAAFLVPSATVLFGSNRVTSSVICTLATFPRPGEGLLPLAASLPSESAS